MKQAMVLPDAIGIQTTVRIYHLLLVHVLDTVLKSRDMTLPTKVHLAKAMVSPVVVYGCKSWTIKKAEHRRIGCF